MSYDVLQDDFFPRNVTIRKPDPVKQGHFLSQTITCKFRILDTAEFEAMTDRNRNANANALDGSTADSDITRIRENVEKVLLEVNGFKRGAEDWGGDEARAYAISKSHICIAIHNEYWAVVRNMNEAKKGN